MCWKGTGRGSGFTGKAAAPHYQCKASRVGLAMMTRASRESRFPRQVHGDEAIPRPSQKVGLGVSQVPDQQGHAARHCSHSVAQVGSQPKA